MDCSVASLLAMTAGSHNAPAKPRHAAGRHRRRPAPRAVHRQPRHHPRSRDEDAAEKALVESGLADLPLRIPRPAPRGDGRSWTELFFLDEATAFAAGHRPCFYCRRDDANRFRACWENGNGVANLRAKDIDDVLHRERLDRGRKRLHPLPLPIAKLPDGAMVQAGGESYLIAAGKPLRWSIAGYREAEAEVADALLITPPSTLRALAAGFQPVLHPSASQSRR